MPAKTQQESVPEEVLDAALLAWGRSGAGHVIAVVGKSMWPSLRDGDRVHVAHSPAALRRGDIVVFRSGIGLVVHRILRLKRSDAGLSLLTQGDNTDRPDPPVPESAIVGRAQAVERDGRRRSLDARAWSWLGWLMAVATIVGGEPARKVVRRLLRQLW